MVCSFPLGVGVGEKGNTCGCRHLRTYDFDSTDCMGGEINSSWEIESNSMEGGGWEVGARVLQDLDGPVGSDDRHVLVDVEVRVIHVFVKRVSDDRCGGHRLWGTWWNVLPMRFDTGLSTYLLKGWDVMEVGILHIFTTLGWVPWQFYSSRLVALCGRNQDFALRLLASIYIGLESWTNK